MIHRLAPPTRSTPPAPPQRRRVIVVGAGLTGMSAALHLGEHCLLLERRSELEDEHDDEIDVPLGPACAGTVGGEDRVPGGARPAIAGGQHSSFVVGRGSNGTAEPGAHALIRLERWQPPDLTAARASATSPSARILAPLLRGELRLDARVVRVDPATRALELEDGLRFVFDKLISTMPLGALASMVTHELPGRVRNDAALRYWLQDHDIEVGDRVTRELYGDIDEYLAGKHIVERIAPALAEKFRPRGAASRRAAPLFRPRLVARAES